MIVCNKQPYALVPLAEVPEFLADEVQVKFWGTMKEVHRTTTGWWYCGLDSVEFLGREPPTWVCPD